MAELRQAEASVEKEVVQWYHRVTELWSDMLEGKDEAVREWLLEAEKLVEMFRHTRPLFLTSRVGSNELLSVWLADIVFPASRFPRHVSPLLEKDNRGE